MEFTASAGGHAISMDAKKPIGADTAQSPKELLLAALCGCTAMDVVSLMRKHKQPLESFSIDAEAEVVDGFPAVFTGVHLTYHLKGTLDLERVKEAVQLSETKYCSISAMISKAVPIRYTVEINGSVIATGEASFD